VFFGLLWFLSVSYRIYEGARPALRAFIARAVDGPVVMCPDGIYRFNSRDSRKTERR